MTLALTGVILAGPLAACPTGADMKKGVLFETAYGNTEVHKTSSPGWVRVQATFPDGEGSILEYSRGLYLATSTPFSDGKIIAAQRNDFASAFNLSKWADPMPSAKWSNDTPDGGQALSGPLKTARIGNCSLKAFDVTIDFDGGAYREVYLYLPDLKTGLLTESIEGDDTERYTYTNVRALP